MTLEQPPDCQTGVTNSDKQRCQMLHGGHVGGEPVSARAAWEWRSEQSDFGQGRNIVGRKDRCRINARCPPENVLRNVGELCHCVWRCRNAHKGTDIIHQQ